MKKLFITFFAGIFFSLNDNIIAQPDTFWNSIDTTKPAISYEDAVNEALGSLDPANFPSGILYNRVPGNNFISDFSGSVTDTASISWDKWFMIYNEMIYSHVTKPAIPEFLELYDTCFKQYYLTNSLNLGLINYEYHFLRFDALDSGWVQLLGEKLFDVPGSPVNPYVAKRVFSIIPLFDTLRKPQVTIKLDANFIYTNDPDPVSHIEADFGDGSGLKIMYIGDSVVVNYQAPGLKQLNFIANYSSGKKLYSSASLQVQGSIAQNKLSGNSAIALSSDPDYEFEMAVQRRGNCPLMLMDRINNGGGDQFAFAKVAIWYNTCYGQNIVRKPVIIATGYDPAQNVTFGATNNMVSNYNNTNYTNNDGKENGFHLLDALRAEGADIIFIDVKNGGDCVENYSKLIEELIKMINGDPSLEVFGVTSSDRASCLNSTNHEPVLISYSLGAVSSRFALAEMEQNNIPGNPFFPHHRVKSWVSFEGENQGCNVQLGLQYYHTFLAIPAVAGLFTLMGSAGGAFGTGLFLGVIMAYQFNESFLGSNTAKQFLYYHRNEQIPNTFFNISISGQPARHNLRSILLGKFMQLNLAKSPINPGYPAFPRLISIANGSSNGTQQNITPAENLFYLHANPYFPFLLSNLRLGIGYNALKNTSNSPLFGLYIQQKFWWSDKWNNLSIAGVNADNAVEYDQSPGSTILQPLLHNRTCSFWEPLPIFFHGNCNAESFCPTVSAHDLHDEYSNQRPLGYNLQTSNLMYTEPGVQDPTKPYGYPHINNPANHKIFTPFDAIYSAEENSEHVIAKTQSIQSFHFGEIAPFALRLQNRTIGNAELYAADFEARDSITAGEGVSYSTPAGKFVVDAQADVTFRAGERIVLRSGFRAVSGSKFHAYIDPYTSCSSIPIARMANQNPAADDEIVESTFDVYIENSVPSKNNDKNETFHIYPNPNTGEFTIYFEKPASIKEQMTERSITIYDIRGKIFEQIIAISPTLSLNIASHPKGIYFIKIINNETVSVHKIIYQ